MDIQREHGGFATGMATVWLLNLLVILAMSLMAVSVNALISTLQLYDIPNILRGCFFYAFLFTQLTQLPYGIFLSLRFKQQRRFSAVKGLFFGAAVALGLNWVLFIALVRFFRYVS